MADPFQNADAAGVEFISRFSDSMDIRQADPAMEAIVGAYLGKLAIEDGARVIEVGAGAGAVSRRIAAFAPGAEVTGFDLSEGFIAEARTRARDIGNLDFEVAPGQALPLEDGAVDAVVMHTVLSHVPEPAELIAEAARVLRPGGRIAICDADFSKASLAGGPDDPLEACARAFVSHFVTDAYLVGKLRPMMIAAGLTPTDFSIGSRVVESGEAMRVWVEMGAAVMQGRGQIGQAAAEALVAEYDTRAEGGTLYGFQVFATAVGVKPV